MTSLPPAPPGWNKTISDLMAEMDAGLRSSLGSPEVDWAREYERSLLPPDARFPQKGDVYESLEDVKLSYLTAWLAPFTGGGKAIFPKGQRLVVPDEPPVPNPIAVYADPVDYKTVEDLVVPAEDRMSPEYSGFYFSVPTGVILSKFRLVQDSSI